MSSPRSIELIARGLIQGPHGVLLCQNLRHGYFYLPGGHVEFGETAAQALERELLEETGIVCRAGSLLLVAEVVFFDGLRDRHEVSKMFHVEHFDAPSHVPSLEPKIAFQWVPIAQVQQADLRPACIRDWIVHPGGFHVVEISHRQR